MEWTESLKLAVSFIENHLMEDIRAEDAAAAVNMSVFYLHKGFGMVTGYTLKEYIRSRRLYLAALDVLKGEEKIIDLAYKYGYETPESFTKAFGRFHGVPPQQLRKDARKIRPFLPLRISIRIQGGNDMDYVVEKMPGFEVIGFERTFTYEDAYREIPVFWEEFMQKYAPIMTQNAKPTNELERAVLENMLGEFGVCIEDSGPEDSFRYLIAGRHIGGDAPAGMVTYRFPDLLWAKFRCVGALPGALQAVNTAIYSEWLPGNSQYKIALGANIEWYSCGDTTIADYESAIWMPVEKQA